MLRRLRKEYGRTLVIEDDREEFVDEFETDWVRSIDSGMTPVESVRIYRENHRSTQAEPGAKHGQCSPAERVRHGKGATEGKQGNGEKALGCSPCAGFPVPL